MDRDTMTISGKKENDVFVFQISGWLNSQSFQKAENQIKQWLATGEKWFIADFTKLAFISSVGLRVLLTMSNNLTRQGGLLVIYGVQDSVLAVFEATGIHKLIPIFKTKAEADKSLSPS